jgi:hypothetical protein
MHKDLEARLNWRRIKFRLQVISKFVSIERWRKQNVEVVTSDSGDEMDENNDPWYIIHHDSNSKTIWNMLTNLIYVISFFMTAFTLAFEFDPLEQTRSLELAIDIIMVIDICTEFVTTRPGASNET